MGEDLGKDFVLAGLGVLDQDGIVDLHEKLSDIGTPHCQHTTVEYIGE